MCANFKPLTLEQLHNLGLPEIPFEYPEEVYPNYATPLLFHSAQGLEWRSVNFGLIPKWAEDKTIGTKTYNARNETLLCKSPLLLRPLPNVILASFRYRNFMSPNILTINRSVGV